MPSDKEKKKLAKKLGTGTARMAADKAIAKNKRTKKKAGDILKGIKKRSK